VFFRGQPKTARHPESVNLPAGSNSEIPEFYDSEVHSKTGL